MLALDLRGHGRSGGRSTLGVQEPDDVDAAVVTAAALAPRRPVVAVGISLGGAASLVAAGRRPACGRRRGGGVGAGVDRSLQPGGRRLARWRERRSGRLLVRVLSGTRLAPPGATRRPRSRSRRLVAAIAPGFVVIAHDPNEAVFGAEHARRSTPPPTTPKALWWTPDAGHGRTCSRPRSRTGAGGDHRALAAAAPAVCLDAARVADTTAARRAMRPRWSPAPSRARARATPPARETSSANRTVT